MSNYNELYKKAQKDLESVRVQKGQVKAKIDELVEELDLDPEQDLMEQVSALKKDLEARQTKSVKELNELVSKLKEFE